MWAINFCPDWGGQLPDSVCKVRSSTKIMYPGCETGVIVGGMAVGGTAVGRIWVGGTNVDGIDVGGIDVALWVKPCRK